MQTIAAVFDSVARPIFLQMKQFNSAHSCFRCYIKADKSGKRFVFPYQRRRQLRSVAHIDTILGQIECRNRPVLGYKGEPILRSIRSFDWIRGSCPDPMHSLDLGVTKRLTSLFFDSKNKHQQFYIKKRGRSEINMLMNSIAVPSSIPRTLRDCRMIGKWKANEFRSWLVYISPLVLKDYLPSPFYNHFLLLAYGIHGLMRNQISDVALRSAELAVEHFAKNVDRLYGQTEIAYTLHLLLHFGEFVRDFGNLNQFSAYVFEHKNGVLKREIKSSNGLIQQVFRRFQLSNTVAITQQPMPGQIQLKRKIVVSSRFNRVCLLITN